MPAALTESDSSIIQPNTSIFPTGRTLWQPFPLSSQACSDNRSESSEVAADTLTKSQHREQDSKHRTALNNTEITKTFDSTVVDQDRDEDSVTIAHFARIFQCIENPPAATEVFDNITAEDFAAIESITSENQQYQTPAKLIHLPKYNKLYIIPAHDPVHEQAIKDLSDPVLHFLMANGYHAGFQHGVQAGVHSNSNINLGGKPIYPDFALSVRNINADDEHRFKWIAECCFSTPRDVTLQNLEPLTNTHISGVQCIIMIYVNEATYNEPDESKKKAKALRKALPMSLQQFISAAIQPAPTTISSIVVGGIKWISLIDITWEVFLPNAEGKFDFASTDPDITAKGTLYPVVDMARIENLLAVAARNFHNSAKELGDVEHEMVPLSFSWRKTNTLGRALEHTAYTRYKMWYNRDATKRKSTPSSKAEAGGYGQTGDAKKSRA